MEEKTRILFLLFASKAAESLIHAKNEIDRSRKGSMNSDRKRPTTNRVLLLTAAVVLTGITAFICYRIYQLRLAIRTEKERLEAAARIEVDQQVLKAPALEGVSTFLNSSAVRAVALFDGATYLATSGGLVKLDAGGSASKIYTTSDGLPDNDLTALASFDRRLFVGTASAGLFSFDGTAFTGYRFNKPMASRVTALVPDRGELLIGTIDGGLFEYSGEHFTRRYASTSGADFNRVTALLSRQSRLYIGTQDKGLYIWREGHIEHLSAQEGLASPHVTGLVELPPKLSPSGAIAIATDFGVFALDDNNQIRSLSARPNITSLALSQDRLWAGLFEGGIVDITADSLQKTSDHSRGAEKSQAAGLPQGAAATVAEAGGRLWALTSAGAYSRDLDAQGPAFGRVFPPQGSEELLTGGQITGLALGARGDLWVGYFDRGVDVLDSETGQRLAHVEDDRVREVNFIASDASQERMLIATSRGLVITDGHSKNTVLTSKQNGLVNDVVAHISLVDEPSSSAASPQMSPGGSPAILVATAGGLTELAGGRARSLTAFHGLARNHFYATASTGSRVFVGSLAGLVELEGLRVVRTYKTSNSRLSHDWVTALAPTGGALFVGTNGGGVDELLPTGEWLNFSDELGRFDVNPNAMLYEDSHLYVGTGDRGLLVYNTRDRRWTRIMAGLTSPSVTAIVSDDQYLWVGTSNGLVRIEKRVIQ